MVVGGVGNGNECWKFCLIMLESEKTFSKCLNLNRLAYDVVLSKPRSLRASL